MSKRPHDTISDGGSSRPSSAGHLAKRKRFEANSLSGATGSTPSTSSHLNSVYDGQPSALRNIVQDPQLAELAHGLATDGNRIASSQTGVPSSPFPMSNDTPAYAPAPYTTNEPRDVYASAAGSAAHRNRNGPLPSSSSTGSARQPRSAHTFSSLSPIATYTPGPPTFAHEPNLSNPDLVPSSHAILYQPESIPPESAATSSSPMPPPSNTPWTGQPPLAYRQFNSATLHQSDRLERVGFSGGSGPGQLLSNAITTPLPNTGPNDQQFPHHYPRREQAFPPPSSSLLPPPDNRYTPASIHDPNYQPRHIDQEQQNYRLDMQPLPGLPPLEMLRVPPPSRRLRSQSLPPGISSPIPQYRNVDSTNTPEDNGTFTNIVEAPPQASTSTLNLSPPSRFLIGDSATILEEKLNDIRDFWNKEIQKRSNRLQCLPANPTTRTQSEERNALTESIRRIEENVRSLSDSFSQQDSHQLAILLRDVRRQNEEAVHAVKKMVLKYGGDSNEATRKIVSFLLDEIRRGRRFLAMADELVVRGEIPEVQLTTASGTSGTADSRSQLTPSSRPLLIQRSPLPNTDAPQASNSKSQLFSCGDPAYNRSNGGCEGSNVWRTGQDALEHLVNHHLFSTDSAWRCFACDHPMSSKESITRHLNRPSKKKKEGVCYLKHKGDRPLNRPKRQTRKTSKVVLPLAPSSSSTATQPHARSTHGTQASSVAPIRVSARNERVTPSSHVPHHPPPSGPPAMPESQTPAPNQGRRGVALPGFVFQGEATGPGPPGVYAQRNEAIRQPMAPPLGYTSIYPQMTGHRVSSQQPQPPPPMPRQTQPGTIANSTTLDQSTMLPYPFPSGSEAFLQQFLRRSPGLEGAYLYPTATNAPRNNVNVLPPHQPMWEPYERHRRVDRDIYSPTYDPSQPSPSTSQWPPPSALGTHPNGLSWREVQGVPHDPLGLPTESAPNFGSQPSGLFNGPSRWPSDIAAQSTHLGRHSLEPEFSSADDVLDYRTHWKPHDRIEEEPR
ncbi:hypothetical protein CPB86DRAFT_795659 [Serendipita vermifera]|nr:hypothetical protein CPB86DRAFT_795659 [Serendipita vermifera]